MEDESKLSPFQLIADSRDERHRQVYCDQATHIEVTYPAHEHSGLPLLLAVVPCNCPAKEVQAPAGETSTDPDHTDEVPKSSQAWA